MILDRYTPRSRRNSWALNALDKKIAEYLPRNGIFVEAGANDGVRQSNTLYLERYLGWNGLLIEAIPDLAAACQENRPDCTVEQCALVGTDYKEPTIEMHYCDLMSMVKGARGDAAAEDMHLRQGAPFLKSGDKVHTIQVPACTLTSVLDKYRVTSIDLLSLDVEGYEEHVLNGIDYQRYAPCWILVEVWDAFRISQVLHTRYDQVAVLHESPTHADILYRRKW